MSTKLTYTGEGSVTGTSGLGYSFSFASLRPEHIQVEVVAPNGTSTTKTTPTHYTIENYNQNGSSNAHIKFVSASARGFTGSQSDTDSYKVKISRQTPSTLQVIFTAGASVTAANLNTLAKQQLFLNEENKDAINSLASADSDGVIQISGSNIVNNSISSEKIINEEVKTVDIQDDAVTNDKLANSIVSAITANTAKETNASHTGDVTGATALTIANNAVTTAKIANGAITQAKINSAVIFTPVGTVITFAGSSAPTGFLVANGDAIPNGSGTVQGVTADFSALHAVVGSTLPNLRDRFVVGAGNNYAVDATGGSADAVVVQHRHLPQTLNNMTSTEAGGNTLAVNNTLVGNYGSGSGTGLGPLGNRHFMQNEGVSGTNKNLPPYYALLMCIKY